MAKSPGFQVIVSLSDKFTAPIKRVNQQIAQSTAKLRGIMAVPGAIMKQAGLGNIGAAFGNIGTQVGKLRSSIAGLLGPFARMGALIGGISLGKLVYDSIAAGGELIKLSQSTGIAVEELQRLQYAAKQSGVSAESMNGALGKLNKSIVGAKKGSKETVAAFKAAGISMAELGKLNTAQVFQRVASAVANTTNETHKQAIAFALLGKSGTELIPVLNEGAWGLRSLGDELESTGALMSTDTARSAKEFGDIMLRLSHHMQGLAYNVLGELLPGLKGGATAMDDWVKANKEWITESVVGVVRDLAAMGASFADIVRNQIIPTLQAFRPIWDATVAIFGEGNTLLLAFTAVVAPGIIGAILGITKAVAGLGIALVANPIGAAILAIVAAIAGAVYLIWRHWDSIVAAFTEAWAAIKRIGRAFTNGISQLFEAWDIAAIAAATWGAITETITAAFSLWKDLWVALLQFLIGDWESSLETLKGIWDYMPGWVTDTLGAVLAAITGAAAGLRDAILSALTSPIEFVKEKWNALVGWLTAIWDRIAGIFGGAAKLPGGAGAADAGAGPAALAAPSEGYMTPSQRRAAFAASKGPAALAGAQQPSSAEGPAALAMAGAQQASAAEVTVNFANLPEGARVSEGRTSGGADLTLNTTYAGPRGAIAGAY